MDFGDTVDAVAAEDGQMGHVDLSIPEDGDVACLSIHRRDRGCGLL